MNRRSLLLIGLMLALAGGARAEVRRYAVVSLMGNVISMVGSRVQMDSRLDRNLLEKLPVAGGVFDKEALLAVDAALKRQDGAAQVKLYAPTQAELFERQTRFFSGSNLLLPVSLSEGILSEGATHLILITKLRADANFQAADVALGTGQVEGLGFYIDRDQRITNIDSGESAAGLLVPFLYVRVSLVDLRTGIVLNDRRITASSILSTAGKDAIHPWDSMTPEQKVGWLRGAISKEVRSVVPDLLAVR